MCAAELHLLNLQPYQVSHVRVSALPEKEWDLKPGRDNI